MLKIKKWKLIVSSIVTVLPILAGLLLWKDLPDNMVTHWGADGSADGITIKAVVVFLFPLFLLAFQWLCLLLSSLDKKRNGQNEKAMGIVYWIIPVLSVFASGMIYAVALGHQFDSVISMPILFCLLFIYIGNYMPKIQQNRSLGIKISWTLNNEENWNKTHRYAGKVWVIGGLCMLPAVFLPAKVMILVLIFVIFALILIPVLYSYSIYRKHKKQGIHYTATVKTKAERAVTKISAVILPLILVGIAVLMFVGDISVSYEETAFRVDATFWTESVIDYDSIENIEYRESGFEGYRISGFGSAKLSLGQFKNEELGTYISYIYNGCDACVILYVDDELLILNAPDKEATRAIYETLQEKIK